MAQLVDEKEKPVVDDDTVNLFEEQEVQAAAPEREEPEVEEEEIPEKYRGKTTKELIRMHQEAEKAYGRTGTEVGELRKLVDSYIKNQLVETAPPPAPKEEEDDIDLYTDPDAYIDKKLRNHPEFVKISKEREAAKKRESMITLESRHPDYREIINDGEFAKWIQASKVRTRLFIEADQGYDADAADELLTTWKEKQSVEKATLETDKVHRREAVRQASTGSARGAETPSSKKKYRRADIMNLMTRDPERYQQLAGEILLAYKEKRVI